MEIHAINILYDFCIISALLLVAKIIRSRVKFIQKLYIPSSLLAGILGLIGGKYFLNVLPFSTEISSYSSILIGRKGKNLDALQLLANIYAGRLGSEDIRIVLDVENYRIRREESIVRLAYTTADKVHQSHKSILLEPMNPFERRLIHTTLNDIPDIETKSEGEGLYKQVRVIYKGLF